MPRGEIIGSIRGEHKACKGGLTEDLNRGRRKVKSAVMRNLPYEITSTEVTSAEMYDGRKKKRNVGQGAIAPLKLLPTLSAPAGVGSAPGNKFGKRRAKNKDATNHTSHCSPALRTAVPRKG